MKGSSWVFVCIYLHVPVDGLTPVQQVAEPEPEPEPETEEEEDEGFGAP